MAKKEDTLEIKSVFMHYPLCVPIMGGLGTHTSISQAKVKGKLRMWRDDGHLWFEVTGLGAGDGVCSTPETNVKSYVYAKPSA